MIVASVVKFVFDNVWRTVALFCLLIILMMTFMLKYKALAIARVELERDTLKVQFTQIEATAMVQAQKLSLNQAELALLKQQQKEREIQITGLLKDWPQECSGAAARAKEILNRRNQ